MTPEQNRDGFPVEIKELKEGSNVRLMSDDDTMED